MIKEYFFNYALHMSDVSIDLRSGTTKVHRNDTEDWKISLIDTGPDTMTGGRLRQALQYLGDDEDFCLTYGDGVSDLDVGAAIEFHRSHGRKATVTAVRPASRYGQLALVGDTVSAFAEKPVDEGGWINGGFFVLDRSIGHYLGNSDDACGSASRSSASPRKASFAPISTMASGSRWIRSATVRCSKPCGSVRRPRGRCGPEPRVLAGPQGPPDGPYRLQGQLAAAAA